MGVQKKGSKISKADQVNQINSNNSDFVNDSWSAFMETLSDGDGSTGIKYTRAKRDNKTRLTETQLDKICRNDSIAVTVCEIFASDMVSSGIDINDKQAKKIYDFYDTWKFPLLLEECIFYHYFYGGSAIILDVDDGKDVIDWKEPLDFNNLKAINELVVVDRYFLQPKDYNNPLKEPETYWLQYGSRQVEIHKSRLILMKGLNAGKRNRYENDSFGESLIFRGITEIDNYHDIHDMIPNIAEQFLTNMFKFKGLMGAVNAGKSTQIKTKTKYLQAMKNPLGAMVLDMDDDYVSRTLNVTGLDKLVDIVERKLCAVFQLPHTRLLQESPGGGLTNNGGKSEQSTQHNKKIMSEIVKYVCPAYDQFNKIAQIILKLGKKPIKYEINPLIQQTKSEIIKDRLESAKTKEIYNNMVNGALAETILEQTFGQGYYSDEMELTPEQMNIIRKSVAENRVKKANESMTKGNNPEKTIETETKLEQESTELETEQETEDQ